MIFYHYYCHQYYNNIYSIIQKLVKLSIQLFYIYNYQEENKIRMGLLIQFILLTVFCAYLVHYYSSPQVSLHIKLCSLVAWVLNFGMALLVPEDLFYSRQHKQQLANTSQYKTLSFQYLFLYWTVYIMTWTIIPLLQQWDNAGDLQSRDRFKRSLRTNGIFYLYLLIGGIIFLVFLILIGAAKDMGLTTYLKCLATCFGIFLLMILMGYSIVQIPRSLQISSDCQLQLRYLYSKIEQIQEELEQAEDQFRNLNTLINLKRQTPDQSKDILQYCEASWAIIPQQVRQKLPRRSTTSFINRSPTSKLLNDNTLQSSIQLHRLIKRNVMLMRRLNKTLKFYVQIAILNEDIEKAMKQNKENLETPLFKCSKIYWLWLKAKLKLKKYFSYAIIAFSAVILISQTQVFLSQKTSILRWIIFGNSLATQRIQSLLVIIFISYLVYYSFFRLKISNLYGLYHKQSDGPSLMFATINFSRVGFAIVLNYFNMLRMESVYTLCMQTPDMGLLGEWVIKGMPGILWLIVLAHYWNVWDRLMRFLGMEKQFGFNQHIFQDQIKIPSIVNKERQKLQAQRQNRQFFE